MNASDSAEYAIRFRIQLQQVGTPAHFCRQNRSHLQETFQGRGLGCGGMSHGHHDQIKCPQSIFLLGVCEESCVCNTYTPIISMDELVNYIA